MTAPVTGVVARWTTRRPPAPGDRCDECGLVLRDAACGRCGQLAGRVVAMLATVVESAGERRLVIAEHDAEGWTPIRTMAASPGNVAALTRPGGTGPTPTAATIVGGLW